MKLIDGHHPPEWSAFHEAVSAEHAAREQLHAARQHTNAAILRARRSGRVTVQEMAEVLDVSESTVRNREKQVRK